jgi:hypothetical protein
VWPTVFCEVGQYIQHLGSGCAMSEQVDRDLPEGMAKNVMPEVGCKICGTIRFQ